MKKFSKAWGDSAAEVRRAIEEEEPLDLEAVIAAEKLRDEQKALSRLSPDVAEQRKRMITRDEKTGRAWVSMPKKESAV